MIELLWTLVNRVAPFDLLADADDIIYHLDAALAIDIVDGLVGYIDAHT